MVNRNIKRICDEALAVTRNIAYTDVKKVDNLILPSYFEKEMKTLQHQYGATDQRLETNIYNNN